MNESHLNEEQGAGITPENDDYFGSLEDAVGRERLEKAEQRAKDLAALVNEDQTKRKNELSDSDYDFIIQKFAALDVEQKAIKQQLINALKSEIKLTYDQTGEVIGEAIWERYGRGRNNLGDEHKQLLLQVLSEVKNLKKLQ